MSSHGGPTPGVQGVHSEPSPYLELDRSAWAALAPEMPSPLTAEEITRWAA